MSQGQSNYDRNPWRQAQIAIPPSGLREAVLRMQYVLTHPTKAGPKYLQHTPVNDGIERCVRKWARGDGATPEQWAELVALVTKVA